MTRLETILSLLSPNDKIIDIGTDHAYIPMEIAKKGANKVLATDIHRNALEIAQKNIQKNHLENKIETKCTDGLMGTSTIKHILIKEKLKNIKKIILESHNDLEELRIFMNELEYTLKEEKAVKEREKYYLCMKYEKGKETLTEEEFLFGKKVSSNQFYYEHLKETYESLLSKVPKEKQEVLTSYISILEKYIT